MSRVRILPAPRQRQTVRSNREGRRDARARRRVARAGPRDQEGTDARATGPPVTGISRGDALQEMPERPHVRHEGADLGCLPGSADEGDPGAAVPAGAAGRRSASRPSRPRGRRRVGPSDRRPIQLRNSELSTIAPRAAAVTRENDTSQGAHLGSAIGSRRERSGSTSPSHSSTTRSSR